MKLVSTDEAYRGREELDGNAKRAPPVFVASRLEMAHDLRGREQTSMGRRWRVRVPASSLETSSSSVRIRVTRSGVGVDGSKHVELGSSGSRSSGR